MPAFGWFTLAQTIIWDDAPEKTPAPAQRPMSFHDLQTGFRQWNDGATDNTFRNGLLVVVAIVAVFALIVHLRQRRQSRQAIDSPWRLGWELSRLVRFPFGTRVLLWWVAWSTRRPVALLLISPADFHAALSDWAAKPTFAILRRWGRSRLARLEPILFDAPP